MKALIVVLLLLLAPPTRANTVCGKPVSYLQEGSKADCTGFLFSPEKEEEIRVKITNYDVLQLINKTQLEQIDILSQRLKISQEQNQALEKFFYERKDKEWYVNIAFFIGGALITAFIASNVK